MGSCLSLDAPRSTGGGDGRKSSKGLKKRKKKKKKRGGSSSFRKEESDQLHKIPERLFFNGSTDVTSLFTQQGRKGTNQDAMITWEKFGSRDDTVFCGVFDGHGPYGHLVARRVRDTLPLKLISQMNSSTTPGESLISTEEQEQEQEFGREMHKFESEEGGDTHVLELEKEEGEIKHPEIFTAFKESFLTAFKSVDTELRAYPNIDSFCSGTTAVTLIKQGQDLIIGNVGDSRAVLGTRNHRDNNSFTAVQLTVDLKPNLPKEEERIKRCKGRVFALQDEPKVPRVWLPDNDSPGLAMARAFGDFCLKDFGLISVPDVSYRHLTDRDEFVVLATDGVWDVLSNAKVVEVVVSAPSRASAARCLVESAVRAWKYKYPTSKIDDCAAVCLFLNPEGSDSTVSYSDSRLSDSSEEDEDEALGVIVLERCSTVRSNPDLAVEVASEEEGMVVVKSRSGKRPLDEDPVMTPVMTPVMVV